MGQKRSEASHSRRTLPLPAPSRSNVITYGERDLTPAELTQVQEGFALTSAQAGEEPAESFRLTTVAQEGPSFVGCASGLFSNSQRWFYLTDLFVQRGYRGQGIGSRLLQRIEKQASTHGAHHLWTRTESHGALSFYLERGYVTLFELPDWYRNGHSHVGLQKQLSL